MSSRGRKSSRDLAIDALTRISRHRPSPSDLWGNILDAHDSLLVEYESTIGALTAFHIQEAKIRPIPNSTFAVIISTAVEQALELAIMTHFVVDDDAGHRMFDDTVNGPLGTFAAKIKMGHVLGIYPKIAQDELDMIRLIRNAFSHSWEQIDFSTQAIIDGCQELQIPKRNSTALAADASTSKAKYIVSARGLYIYLEWDSIAAGKGPMLYKSHPGRGVFEDSEATSKEPAP